MEGGRLCQCKHCSKAVQAAAKAIYCSGSHDKYTTACGEVRTWVLSHHSQASKINRSVYCHKTATSDTPTRPKKSLSRH